MRDHACRNLANRFTGWTDVDLTPLGEQEAKDAGKVLKAEVRYYMFLQTTGCFPIQVLTRVFAGL